MCWEGFLICFPHASTLPRFGSVLPAASCLRFAASDYTGLHTACCTRCGRPVPMCTARAAYKALGQSAKHCAYMYSVRAVWPLVMCAGRAICQHAWDRRGLHVRSPWGLGGADPVHILHRVHRALLHCKKRCCAPPPAGSPARPCTARCLVPRCS